MLSANRTDLENFTGSYVDQQPSASFVFLLVVLILTGTMANGYVIVALLKKLRRWPLNMTIINLALVDGLVFLVVVPMCLVTLMLPDVTTFLCIVNGTLGQVMMTYSLHVQSLILYASFSIVTNLSPNNKTAVGFGRLALISLTCLAVDAFVVVYPGSKYGILQKLSTAGFCFFVIDNEFWKAVARIFYVIHMSTSVLLCTSYHIVLTRFVRKNSARAALIRQRQISIFKMMFRKLLIWVLCYSFILVTRTVGYKNNWPEVTFQASYVLLWSNSLVNPLCHILTSPLRKTIVTWCSTLVAKVTLHRDTDLTDEPKNGSKQQNDTSLPGRAKSEQRDAVNRSLPDRTATPTRAPVYVTDADGNHTRNEQLQQRTDTFDPDVTQSLQRLTISCHGHTEKFFAKRQRLVQVKPIMIQPDDLSNPHFRLPENEGVDQASDQSLWHARADRDGAGSRGSR